MRYGDNRPKIQRRIIFAVLILIAALLQNAGDGFLRLFGAPAFLLVPLVICISMFEREVDSALFGALAGVLWDVCTGKDGFCALLLMVLCAVSSIVTNHFLRNNLLSACLLSGLSIAVFEICYLFVFLVLPGAHASVGALTAYYLPAFLFTFLWIPLFYYPVKNIFNAHKTTDD